MRGVKTGTISAREAALKVARDSDGSFDALAVVLVANCSKVTAQVALGKLDEEKALDRVARGFFARPGLFKREASPTARAFDDAASRALAAANAWLQDCPPLPAARVPEFDAPKRVRRM